MYTDVCKKTEQALDGQSSAHIKNDEYAKLKKIQTEYKLGSTLIMKTVCCINEMKIACILGHLTIHYLGVCVIKGVPVHVHIDKNEKI